MRGEVELKEQAIANLNSEIKTLTGENKTLVADLLECRPALESVRDELKEREQAIAKLKTELEAGEVKQLTLFPGQEPTERVFTTQVENPTPTPEPKAKTKTKTKTKPTPETNPEEIDFTGTIPRGELVKFINEKFKLTPPIEGHRIGDCFVLKLNGKTKSQKLSTYESDYGFKYVGMLKGEHRFRLNSNP